MDDLKSFGVVGIGDEGAESDGFEGSEHGHVEVDTTAELLAGGDDELSGLEGGDFEAGFEHLLVGQVDDLLDRTVVPEQVQIFMHGNTASQSLNKIISICIQLGETVDVLSELNFGRFSIGTGTAVFTGVIIVGDMAIEPLSVFPRVIVFLRDFEVGNGVVEEFRGLEAGWEVDD